MKFEHRAQEETHRKVVEHLSELFDDPFEDEESGSIYVRYGSTVLEVSVLPYGPSEVSVNIMSYCVQGAEIDERLLADLLELNHHLPFGAFSVVGNDIFFSHSLFGRSLDSRDLLSALAAVATISDDYDDRIVAKYGGQTALDRIRDTGGQRRRGRLTSVP